MNLVELVSEQLSHDALMTLSSKIGADATQTELAASAAVPALLNMLRKRSMDSAGSQKLCLALADVDTKSESLEAIMTRGGVSDLIKHGSLLLSRVLAGSGQLSPFLSAVSDYSGLSHGSASGLMGVVTSRVLTAIKRQLPAEPHEEAIRSLLEQQDDNISAALPTDLLDTLENLTSPAPTAQTPEPSSADLREALGEVSPDMYEDHAFETSEPRARPGQRFGWYALLVLLLAALLLGVSRYVLNAS